MKKKLLLISPVPKDFVNQGTAVPVLKIPPLALAHMAGLTPRDWQVKIIDENKERYDGEEADIVAMTAMTSAAPRAYEIAQQLKGTPTKTILGGIHATVCPKEASRYVDTVVTGEADAIWPQVLQDAEHGRLKREYKGTPHPMKDLPHPRWGLFSKSYTFNRFFDLIQTARGCPMDCDFCSVTSMNGRVQRQRPIDEVLDEIESLRAPKLLFVDDNIVGHGPRSEERTISLLKGMKERGIRKPWAGQASINFIRNKEILKLAYETGCLTLFVGFESLNEKTLKAMHKVRNLKEGVNHYKRAIDEFHRHNIAIMGGFIFGNDEDTPDIFEKTRRFVLESGLDGSQYSILTPLPGTRLFKKMKEEGRLLYTDFPHDWRYFNVADITFLPTNMSPQQLVRNVKRLYQDTMKGPVLYRRALRTLWNTQSLFSTGLSFLWNYGYEKGFCAYHKDILLDV